MPIQFPYRPTNGEAVRISQHYKADITSQPSNYSSSTACRAVTYAKECQAYFKRKEILQCI